ncbi:uncharacterized protein KY384_002088 [Bacidia gigantensis]|uniref:uncharacterized protein n=1 Tax=Bacidia gigantensis TaxID=2732470 RepID=UPI001D044E0F|nr:uncharacterized protein KY384_002088 [Bacidia gigantensis]KAG8533305.1 hypothetical protein KY384_002088 [Bacidia gigantensis]
MALQQIRNTPRRLGICSRCLRQLRRRSPSSTRHLATATVATPAADPYQIVNSPPPIARYPASQPPSHKPPDLRNAQLIRQYTSLLRSTPLMIFFSHFNLQAREWSSLRRELTIALAKCDKQQETDISPGIKVQVIQTVMFEYALRLTDYYRPSPAPPPPHPTDPSTPTSESTISNVSPNDPSHPSLTHDLSRQAYSAILDMKNKHPLTPLLHGPIALLTFSQFSPPHLAAALSILAPDKASGFPAPKRRVMPGYYDPPVQSAVQKLLLLGARAEGRVFDHLQVRWVGGLEGMEGLRAQLVQLLGASPAGLVRSLEAVGTSVWATMEGRRTMLGEEEKGE